jgi:hydrogenase maturation protease
VIGVGNPYRRDDGIGPALATAVEALDLPGVTVLTSDGEPSRLLDAWTGAGLAVVVDATRRDGAMPGPIHRFAEDCVISGGFGSASTHGLGIAGAIKLGRVLDRLPMRLVIFAVDVEDVGYGDRLSQPVATAIPELTNLVLAELRAEASSYSADSLAWHQYLAASSPRAR